MSTTECNASTKPIDTTVIEVGNGGGSGSNTDDREAKQPDDIDNDNKDCYCTGFNIVGHSWFRQANWCNHLQSMLGHIKLTQTMCENQFKCQWKCN